MHGFIAGFLASRFGKKIPLIYHNHDLVDLDKTKGLNYIIKSWELRLAPYADRIVFPDINRARFFKEEVKLNKLPDIVMNTPLRINALPSNRLKEALEVKGFNANAKVVLYQGVISETQSILEVIKSMALWPKNTVLVLLGYISGDFLEKVYDITKSLDLAQRVIYIPSVRYPDYTNYTIGGYIGLALYKPINTNFKFNCGASNKLFEYISLGIPVITNDSVYFKEVLDSSYAYFARPDSVEDIGRVVNSVFLDEEEYSRKCQAARDIHLTRFNYEEQFRPVVEYIRQTTEYGE
jgi:glycosyltransferase involved in cell wall biosynthesis